MTLLVLDSVRDIRRDDFAPEAIRLQQSTAVVHRLKRRKWLTVTAWRRVRGLTAPIGSVARYDLFFQWALIATTLHRPVSLDVPTVVICASDRVVQQWQSEPTVTIVRVGGDHLSMLQPPHVSAVADAIRTVAESLSA